MLFFENDYSEGAHEAILRRLTETNEEKLSGYGTDSYSISAKEKIRRACECPGAEVCFLCGGTQTNQIVIDAMLQDYEGVVAASTGHINVHEAGAVEYTGHKVLDVPGRDGKISAADLRRYLENFFKDANHEHMVFPGMVYISHPTEMGTLYTKEELREISSLCREYQIPLYLDGARLGYGLACPETDVTLPDIAEFCDVFYIGGTKVGALCGEAVVFTGGCAPRHLVTVIKQHGALLAKGRLLGVQFDTLFSDRLYLEIGKSAVACARRLREALRQKGYRFYCESPTNQLFVILDDDKMKKLSEEVRFSFWEKYDDTHTVVRFATSWATTPEDVEGLIARL